MKHFRKLVLFLLVVATAHAHLGSPDTFVQAQAGPYKFLLAAHPPQTYPGALQLDLRLDPNDHVTQLTEAIDSETPAAVRIFDAGTATATLWVATPQAHTIRIDVQGSSYTLNLPAAANAPQPSNKSRAVILIIVGLTLLGFGGWLVYDGRRRFGFVLIATSFVAVGCAISDYAMEGFNHFYFGQRTSVAPTLTSDGHLNITLSHHNQSFADLIPDHGKLLHLFLIREPQKDVILHLHPEQVRPGSFTTQLPSMPPGTYTLFADFYHGPATNPVSETATTQVDLPSQQRPGTNNSDDSYANLPPLARPNLSDAAHLFDGYRLTLRSDPDLTANTAHIFHVELLDPAGHAPADMAFYLGMNAHAVVLRDDDAVFAHIHPGGTLPMLMPVGASMSDMPGMNMSGRVSNTADIPYGFPAPGNYRLFVQMKHGTVVETGAFDLTVR